MALDVEQIVDRTVNREESLRRALCVETLRLSFSASYWYVRPLRPIISSMSGFVKVSET